MAEQAEKAMLFQQVELREGISPVIKQAQFIWAVADNMKELHRLHQAEHSLAFMQLEERTTKPLMVRSTKD